MMADNEFKARGSLGGRLVSVLFLLPAWFSPHKSLRVFFHRLRGVRIGRAVEIGYFCIIGNVHPAMVTIEDGAVIAARATLLEHDNAHYYTRGAKVRFGEVRIGRKAFVGIGAVVLPGIEIGERAIVGANSVVRRNVAPGAIVAGVPATPLREGGTGIEDSQHQ